MTFFANSGVRWPSLDEVTRDAGQKALHAASQMWGIISDLEGETPGRVESSTVEDCVSSFKKAAKLYRGVAKQTDGLIELSQSQRDLAAVDKDKHHWGYRSTSSETYYELARRLETLASQVAALKVDASSYDLAPQVFQMMNQWEAAAELGRVVAVVNREKERDKD